MHRARTAAGGAAGRWVLGWTALAVALGVGAAEPGRGPPQAGGGAGAPDANEVCELRGADRARTPSQVCMRCHDGSAGRAISFSMRVDGRGMDHPVSVDYWAAEGRHPGKYWPQGRLPPDVPLVEGKVECTSCHDGGSSSPKRVVDQPQLCNVCHNL